METNTKKDNRALIAIFAVSILLQTTTIVQIVIPGLREAFPEVSLNTIQLVGTIPSVLAIAAQLITGPLSMKVPKKTIILVSLVCCMFGGLAIFFLAPTVTNFMLVLVGNAMIGFGCGGLAIALQSSIVELYSGEKKGSILGVQSFFAYAGTMVMLSVAGLLAKKGWYYSYVLFALYIIVIILVAIFMPKVEVAPKEDKPKEKKDKPKLKGAGLGVWLCFMMYITYFICKYVHSLNYGLFITTNGLGDSAQVGLCGSILTCTGMLTGLVYGYIQKLAKKRSLTVGMIVCILGLTVVSASSSSLIGIYFGAVLLGFGGNIIQTSVSVVMSDLCGVKLFPVALAFTAIFANLGVSVSPMIINTLSKTIFDASIRANYIVAAILMVIPFVLSIIVSDLANKKAKEREELGEL